MDVLQKGISKETWRLKITCPHCSAKLEISYKNLKFEVKRNFLNTPKLFLRTKCTECGNGILIKQTDIPNTIQRAVYDKMDLWEYILTFGF